jgi:predicted MFS family arabinose efflux permease
VKRQALAAFAALGAFWGGWAALVPSVQQAVGASKGELGAALLCVGVGSLPAMLLTGAAVDRYGPRVLAVALAAFGGAAVLPALASSVRALAGGLLLVGAASGAVDVAMNAEIAAIEAESGRRLMHFAHALFSVGVIVGAVATGIARQAGSGGLGVLSGLGAALLAVAIATRSAPRRVALPRVRRRLRPALVVLGAACAASFVVEGGIENWSALFLERQLDAAPVVSALGPGCFAAAMVAGRLSGHRLAGRLGDALLLAAGGACAAAGLVLASRAPSAFPALLGFAIAGTGASVAAPTLFGAAGRAAGEAERGSAVATVTTVAYLGFLAGPPLVGATAQALGLRTAFLVLAGAAALVAASAPRLPLPPG